MKTRPAFTIIELILVIGLSSIIIFGLMQAYNNVMTYLKTIQEMQGINRKVCLLFNQMERDFMTAFIPPIIKKITPEKEGGGKEVKPEEKDKQEKKPEEAEKAADKEKEEQKRQEILKKFFMANIDDNNLAKRINDHRTYPFKNVTLINTNPLQIYGQSKVRIVRIMYELVVDKKRSKGENYCYNLWRKETEDLQNFKVKEDEVGITTKSKTTQIRKHLVADGIKDLFIQYVYQARPKSKEAGKEKEDDEDDTKIEERALDTWGDKKETIGVVPNRVNVFITFWDEKLYKTADMQATFPVMSFSLKKEIENKEGTTTAQTPPAPGSTPAVPGGMPPAAGAPGPTE